MMKLKRIDGGMYCFLLTFDPGTEMINIVDLQGNGIGSQPLRPAPAEMQSGTMTGDQQPFSQTVEQKSQKIVAGSKPLAPTALGKTKSEVPIMISKDKVISQQLKENELPKPAREYRPRDLVSRREAAAYLGVAEQTLAIWKCTGRQSLPYLKVGKLIKYKVADLDAFLDRMKHDPENPQKSRTSGKSTYSNNRKLEF